MVGGLTTSFNALSSNVGALNSTVGSLSTSFASLSSNFSSLSMSVSALSASVSAVSTQLQSLSQQFAAYQQQTQLEDRTLRQGVAMSLAMDGVGTLGPDEKVAISMNVGTYGGQNGLAAGVAFRAGEHLSFNGGVGGGLNGGLSAAGRAFASPGDLRRCRK
jgi:autotransporter adhesin